MSIGKRFRFLYRFLITYISRHARFIFVSFVVGFLLFFLGVSLTPLVGQLLLPDIKRVGIVGRYTPATLPVPVLRLIGMGLTEVAENGEPKPGVAQSWQVTNDGKTYTFHLMSDLVWHDGKEFTSADVDYNISDVSFIPKDSQTLEVVLKEPFVPLPVLLSRPLLRPGLVGLGPYKVTALKLKGGIVKSLQLTPVAGTTDKFKQHQSAGTLPRLILRFYFTEEQAKTAFKLGEVDILENISDVTEFAGWSNVDISHRVDHRRFIALFYNLQNLYLSDKAVRQALSFAVPTFEFERASGPISPLSWAYNNKVRQYKFDIDAARRLLKKDKQSEATSSGELTISTFAPYLNLAKRIAESWKNLGFTVRVKIEDAVPEDFQILLATQEIPPDPDQYPLWHSTQKDTNITHLANPKIDKLLEDGRVTFDKKKRLEIYADFQRYLVDEAPATFLYYPSVYTITRK